MNDVARTFARKRWQDIVMLDGSGRPAVEAVPTWPEILDVDPDRPLERQWALHDNDRKLQIPIGYRLDWLDRPVETAVEMELSEDQPQLGIQGTTGSGATLLWKQVVLSLLARYSPDRMEMVVAQYGANLAADIGGLAPHVPAGGSFYDLADDTQRQQLETFIEQEMKNRERVLSDAGLNSIAQHRADHPDDAVPDLVIAVEGFVRNPDIVSTLRGVAMRGARLGVFLISMGTSYGEAVRDLAGEQRVSLRVMTREDSERFLGSTGAEDLPLGSGLGYVTTPTGALAKVKMLFADAAGDATLGALATAVGEVGCDA